MQRQYYELGQQQKDTSQAIHYYKEALKIDPSFELAHNAIGLVYYKINKMEAALNHLNQAISWDPSNASFYTNRGSVLFALGQLKPALEDQNHAILIDMLDPVFYYNRGMIQNSLGNNPEAILDFDRALTLNKDHMGALNCLNKLLINITELDADKIAKKDLYRAIKKLPGKNQVYILDLCLNENKPLGQRFRQQEGIKPCNFNSGHLQKILRRRIKLAPNRPVSVTTKSIFKPLKNNDLMSNKLDDAHDENNHGFSL